MAAEVAFSSVDKKAIKGEIPVRLCNYTDVFYNRRLRPAMDFMAATAKPTESERWNLRRGDVLFTKDSETPDEIGIPAFVEADMPDVVCGYHLGIARPHAELLDGAYLAEVLGSPKLSVQFAPDSQRGDPIRFDPWGHQPVAHTPAVLGRAGNHRNFARWRRCDACSTAERAGWVGIIEKFNRRRFADRAGPADG